MSPAATLRLSRSCNANLHSEDESSPLLPCLFPYLTKLDLSTFEDISPLMSPHKYLGIQKVTMIKIYVNNYKAID